MSTHSVSSLHSTRSSRFSTSWLESRPLWAGLAIITMWLAVLFVGVFGGDIVSATPGGSSSSVPVVVVVAGVALLGTLVVGRRAFTVTAASDDLRRALEEEQEARAELAEEVANLRAKLPSSEPENQIPGRRGPEG
jgi:hypothetical protein